jgi:DMSO reductase anchor subunit
LINLFQNKSLGIAIAIIGIVIIGIVYTLPSVSLLTTDGELTLFGFFATDLLTGVALILIGIALISEGSRKD